MLDGGETLQVTRHHRLFSADRGEWVHAGDVQDGEALQTQDGVVHAKHAGTEALAPIEVFNLEVFGAHQYFVGAHRVLAHNVYVGGEAWRVFQPGEVACQSGCEGVAKAIQSEIGGAVQQITPAAGRFLGQVRNAAGEFVNPAGAKALGWSDHYVVVQGGRVFDALTGPQGLGISEYKALASRFEIRRPRSFKRLSPNSAPATSSTTASVRFSSKFTTLVDHTQTPDSSTIATCD
jgi:hypothetical protein